MEQLKSKRSRKFLTLNIHSWMEPESLAKQVILADVMAEEAFDVAAFQEVNQSMEAQEAGKDRLVRSQFCEGDTKVTIKQDNYGLLLAEMLLAKGKAYYWTWVPSHIGYDRFDEGVALFSKRPILQIRSGYVSETKDFNDFRARMVVGIQVRDGENTSWFYSVHLSRWSDGPERFKRQWERLESLIGMEEANRQKPADCSRAETVWVMGDFNNPAQDIGEGYDLVLQDGKWKDSFIMCEGPARSLGGDMQDESQKAFQEGAQRELHGGLRRGYTGDGTVKSVIDGWRDTGREAIRIDYIMVNREMPVLEYKTIFDGKTYPVVSDHYGVMAEVEAGGQIWKD